MAGSNLKSVTQPRGGGAANLLVSFSLDSRDRRHLFQLIGGTGLAQVILFGSTPIVTRLYTPEHFGALGLFTSIVGVGVVFATAKYDFAIVSARTAREAQHLLLGCIALSVVVALFSMALFASLRSAEVFGPEVLPPEAILLMGPAIVLTAAFLTIRQSAVRQTRFAMLSNSLIAQSGGKSITQIGLGTAGAGCAGLIVAEVVGRAIACAVCIRKMRPDVFECYKRFRWSRIASALIRNRRFPLFCLPSTLVNTIALVLPAPMMIFFYGMGTGGAFVIIWRVLTLPISVLGGSVADVFHQKMALNATRGDKSALRLLDRTVLRLFALGLLPAVSLAFAGEWFIAWALGPEWKAAGEMGAAMAPWMLAQFVVSPVSHTMSVYRAHNVKLPYDFATLFATVASISITASYEGSYMQAMYFLSWLNVAAYVLFYLLLRLVVVRRLCKNESPMDLPHGEPPIHSANRNAVPRTLQSNTLTRK